MSTRKALPGKSYTSDKYHAIARVVPQTEPDTILVQQKSNETRTVSSESSKRILVVDDEPINLLVVENHLSLKGYFVKKVTNGKDALDAVDAANRNNKPFDLIVLDVMMPGMSGIEVCKYLREENKPDQLPVIMLTAKNRVEDLLYGLQAGANDYLAKPFSKEELLARIDNHLRLKQLADENKRSEKRLAMHRDNLEKEVAIRTKELIDSKQQIKASLEEKEVLLKEIHHRVKNNMQVISSLIKFQTEDIKDEQYVDMFKECQNRIRTMSLLHEKLYRSENLANIQLSDYVKNLVDEVFHSYRKGTAKIDLKLNIEDISIGIDSSIPCGLVINELMSNSMKYAFPDNRDGEIKISICLLNSGEIELIFSDNGIGMPEDIDYRSTQSLGLRLIYKLSTHQLDGKVELDRSNGTEFRIRFKEAEYKKRL